MRISIGAEGINISHEMRLGVWAGFVVATSGGSKTRQLRPRITACYRFTQTDFIFFCIFAIFLLCVTDRTIASLSDPLIILS